MSCASDRQPSASPNNPWTLLEHTPSVYSPRGLRTRIRGGLEFQRPEALRRITIRPRVFLLANRWPLARRTTQEDFEAAAGQSIWPGEPANSRQDNQLMRILPYKSARVKLCIDPGGAESDEKMCFFGRSGLILVPIRCQFAVELPRNCRESLSSVRRDNQTAIRLSCSTALDMASRYDPLNRHILTNSIVGSCR